MKKLAPHVSDKRGSMLMLTLIVFMVILILGMTMITSMLYSQGENNMQINEQKAYYAAFSAVEAVKSYFLNPELNPSPHELIGGEYTYNLTDQGIDEDTTVTLNISREDDQYILIQATGVCQGEESTVTAKMREEVQKGGSGGLYDSEVVFGSNKLMIKKETMVKGNIYIDTEEAKNSSGTIMKLRMHNTQEYKSTLYIRSKSEFELTKSILGDVYMEVESNHHMSIQENTADNMYILGMDWSSDKPIQLQQNTINGELQIHSVLDGLNGYGNKVLGHFGNFKGLVLGFNKQPSTIQLGCDVQNVYISGLKTYEILSLTGNIKNIYVDKKTEGNLPSNAIPIDLSDVSSEERRISEVMSSLSEAKSILVNKPRWDKEVIKKHYPEMTEESEGILKKDSLNKMFEEYYDINTNTRWIFTKDNPQFKPDDLYAGSEWYTIKDKTNQSQFTWNTYYISNDDIYKDDTIFFINHNNGGVNMQFSREDIRLDNFHIYSPYASFSFLSNIEYFGGSIIANTINIEYSGPEQVEFKALNEKIQNTGAPSLSGDSNNSGETTYRYKFDSYIDDNKVS